MRIPAVCDSCGAIFPSAIEVSNSTNISFRGCGSGPCPACGEQGHIPDGIYNFIGSTIELLSGPTRTVAELKRLSKILKEAQKKKSSYQNVTSEIEGNLPELSSINDILPKTRTELYAFVAIIISIIAMLLVYSSTNEAPKIEINNVINDIYKQSSPDPSAKPPEEPKAKRKKIGRNEPCLCGSGKKYKKCCLIKT